MKKLKIIINNDIFTLAVLSIFFELVGRKTFLNADANINLYGARFFSIQGSPYSLGWSGIDTFLGILTNIFGSPEAAITISGLSINVFISIIIYLIFRKNDVKRIFAYTAAFITAISFKVPVGGWISDHISFLVGFLPFIAACYFKSKVNNFVAILYGFCLPICIVLKINSSLPSLVGSSIGILIFYYFGYKNKDNKKILKNSFQLISYTFLGILIGTLLVLLSTGEVNIYERIFYFSKDLINSEKINIIFDKNSEISFEKLPLKINWFAAINQKKMGQLIFFPVNFFWWLSLILTFIKLFILIRKQTDNQSEINRSVIVIVFLLFSVASGITIGRGTLQKLFLMPAGIVLFLSDVSFLTIRKKYILLRCIFLYFSFLITFHAFYYSINLPEINFYKTSNLWINQISEKKPICFEATSFNKDDICLGEKEFKSQIAMLGSLRNIANSRNIIWKNEDKFTILSEVLEKWNSGPKNKDETNNFISDIVIKLKREKFDKVIENFTKIDCGKINKKECDRYIENRKYIIESVMDRINGVKIGSYGDINLWDISLRKNRE